ncbi:hypothetical protein I4U23_012244 [Adineta vaga]|nr:hypothetical protein I4U23_012244 [Adineta vaga]
MAMGMANYNYYNNNDNLETFGLLWLDAAVHTNPKNREAQKQLRETINHVMTFEDPDHFQRYIMSTSVQDRLILIVSGRLGREVVPRIHQIRQLSSIYVYCMDKEGNKKWANSFPKIKAVAVNLDHLISQIKADQNSRANEENPIAFYIFTAGANSEQSTSGINGGFVHSLLLIDVLLRMKTIKGEKQELVDFCRNHYKDNKTQLAIIQEFETKYSAKTALYWYTSEAFIYKMLNKALRVPNIDILFLFRFVIRDIYRELQRLQCQSSIRVYRGQVLSYDELKELRKSIGKMISINSFFSTTVNRDAARQFLINSVGFNDLERVLFVIDADPRVQTTKPFAEISKYSYYSRELEVLFMIGSNFRIKSIQKEEDQIWRIHMIWCDENEHDLINLFAYLKETYGGGDNETDLLSFGRVLRRMGEFDMAEKFYRRLLAELSSNDLLLSSLYYSLGLVLKDQGKLDSSLDFLYKSLDLKIRLFPKNYESLCNCYNVIGTIHQKKDVYDIALSWFNKGIALPEQNNDQDSLTMAHFYHNSAIVCEQLEEDEKADIRRVSHELK